MRSGKYSHKMAAWNDNVFLKQLIGLGSGYVSFAVAIVVKKLILSCGKTQPGPLNEKLSEEKSIVKYIWYHKIRT